MESFSAIILSGGKSSRMGEDKGLMSLLGKSMVEYGIDVLCQLTSSVLIVSNNTDYEKFGLPIVQDVHQNKGPLGGIHAGLTASATETNIILSCDVPYVKAGLINYLLHQSADFDITVPIHQKQLHPLIGIYKKKCLPVIEEQIRRDDLKISHLFDFFNVNIVNTDEFDEINFKNLNSKKDIESQ